MKVLVVTESYWPNADGGAVFERHLVQGLRGDNYQVAVWAPGKYRRSYRETDGNYTIYREKSIILWLNPKYRVSFWPWRSARRIIKAEQPDILHIHNAGLMGLAALFWAKRSHIPVIATNHFMPENLTLNLPWGGRHRFSRWLVWCYLVWFHNRCDFITSPTKTAVNLLKEHGLKRSTEPVSNGVDTDLFHPNPPSEQIAAKYNIEHGKKTILYLGRLDGEKRVDIILHAFAQASSGDSQLVLAGIGNEQKALRKLAKDLQIDSRTVFTGYVDADDKPAIYNLADMFVIASPAELQSIVMLEAMSSGLPALAVNVAALSELCINNQTGFLFARNNYHELAKRIEQLLDDSALRKSLGTGSRELILKYHSKEKMLKAYEAIYNRAMPSGTH